MSHVANVTAQFRDLAILAEAVKPLGGELVIGQRTHEWFGQFLNDWNSNRAAVNRRDPATFGKCDHAIKFKGVNYEIGLIQEADGTFSAVYRFMGRRNRGSGRSRAEEARGRVQRGSEHPGAGTQGVPGPADRGSRWRNPAERDEVRATWHRH